MAVSGVARMHLCSAEQKHHDTYSLTTEVQQKQMKLLLIQSMCVHARIAQLPP